MPLSRIDDYRACQAGECPIGNLFTDAIRWFTGTDVAFTSSGGYRGEGWSAEDGVRLTDLYAALPFPNTGR
jgi:2',3'-cyclic-nucleotide 2'-phosphodiesterase (5'-nucleotidase family)